MASFESITSEYAAYLRQLLDNAEKRDSPFSPRQNFHSSAFLKRAELVMEAPVGVDVCALQAELEQLAEQYEDEFRKRR